MSGLRDLQHEFLNYILEKPSVIVDNIVSSRDVTAKQRLDLYACGYKLRLKEAMLTDYEQLHAYLGDDLFEQLMETYIEHYPSHHPSLRYFSKNIPVILTENEPWTRAPELLEIAVIEKAFCDSFDADDSTTATLQDLSLVELQDWPMLKVRFHDSVQLLSMKHNSVQIWQALSDSKIPPDVEQDPATWLIWRKALVSQYRALSDAEESTIRLMMSGGDFSELCEALLDYYNEEETPQQAIALLQGWLSNEMVCQLVC